ncbi:MAG: flagellar brake domain-containing protein [Candidatus Sumerlaeota bacterium]
MPPVIVQDEIEFDLGTVLHVERRLEGRSLRGTTKVVGAHEPRYLLVDMPLAYGKPMVFMSGEKCIVRFLHKGSLLGFKADVLKVMSDPFPMMLLEYPKSIEVLKLRKEERLLCNIDCNISFLPFTIKFPARGENTEGQEEIQEAAPTPSAPLQGTIIDLASGGCQLAFLMLDPGNYSRKVLEMRQKVPVEQRSNYHKEALKSYLHMGRSIEMNFELPQPAPGIYSLIEAEIRWTQVRNMNFLVGVRFGEDNVTLQKAAQKIIDHQNRYFTHHYDTIE